MPTYLNDQKLICEEYKVKMEKEVKAGRLKKKATPHPAPRIYSSINATL